MSKYFYSVWLGASLSYAGMQFDNPHYWIIIIPTIVLVTMLNNGNSYD